MLLSAIISVATLASAVAAGTINVRQASRTPQQAGAEPCSVNNSGCTRGKALTLGAGATTGKCIFTKGTDGYCAYTVGQCYTADGPTYILNGNTKNQYGTCRPACGSAFTFPANALGGTSSELSPSCASGGPSCICAATTNGPSGNQCADVSNYVCETDENGRSRLVNGSPCTSNAACGSGRICLTSAMQPCGYNICVTNCSPNGA